MPRRLPELDLLQDCVQSVCEQANERVPPSHVTQVCCPYCHHPKCQRAGWADSKWQARINTQEEYLLENPQFSNLVLPRHMEIHSLDWGNLRKKAMKLEISRRRGDWVPVTDAEIGEGPTDGVIETGSEEGTNAIDKALAVLRRKQSRTRPEPPKIVSGIEDPTSHGTLPEYEPLRPQPTAKQRQKMAEMQARMGLSIESSDPETLQKAPLPPEPRRVAPFLGNTPVPRGGIMVEGSPPPPAVDPWAPRKRNNVIKPHAKIRMGGKKNG